MTDISVSERRLIAALDRLDQALDAAMVLRTSAPAPAPAQTDGDDADALDRLAAAEAENARLAADLAALHDRQASALAAGQDRLAAAHERLTRAGEAQARLSAANDALAAANRALMAGAGEGVVARDAALAALNAENEALRAARAAEIAQMGEVLEALDHLLGLPAPDGAARPPERSRAAAETPSLFGAALAADTPADPREEP